MAEYRKITEIELIEEPSEGSTVMVEENGALKRVPYDKVGGGDSGIATAIIKSSNYDNTIAGLTPAAEVAVTYSCVNMTFGDAYALMASGAPLAAQFMLADGAALCMPGMAVYHGTATYDEPCIAVGDVANIVGTLYWTASGLSKTEPGER